MADSSPLYDPALPMKQVRDETITLYNDLMAQRSDAQPFPRHHDDESWEEHYLAACMFDGVSNNGGWVHGMVCFHDNDPNELDAVIRAWYAIGAPRMARAIEAGLAWLQQSETDAFDLLEPDDWDKVDRIMTEAFGDPDDEDIERLLHAYGQRHRGANSPPSEGGAGGG